MIASEHAAMDNITIKMNMGFIIDGCVRLIDIDISISVSIFYIRKNPLFAEIFFGDAILYK